MMTNDDLPRPTRRAFLGGAVMGLAAAAGIPLAAAANEKKKGQTMIELPSLPYAENALEPHISRETISFHYGKHHKAYVDKTNELVAGTDLAGASLEEIVRTAAGQSDRKALFNSAAQVWNHSFYWKSLRPKGGGTPRGALLERVRADFGDFAAFRDALAKAAVGQFGSGWAWVVFEAGKLAIVQTPNAETPITVPGRKPLLTIDVWEHAYYVDYRNRRLDYVTAVIDNLLDWEFAARNLG